MAPVQNGRRWGHDLRILTETSFNTQATLPRAALQLEHRKNITLEKQTVPTSIHIFGNSRRLRGSLLSRCLPKSGSHWSIHGCRPNMDSTNDGSRNHSY